MAKNSNNQHLAQFNLAEGKGHLTSEIMKEFYDFIAPINELAEGAPGFVWRLKDEAGRSSSYFEIPELGDKMLINLSVWLDIQSLKNFTYHTVHSYFVRHRTKWFEKMNKHHLVMWWIEPGTIPSIDEALNRLDLLRRMGPTMEAFDFAHPFEPKNNQD